MSGKDLLAVLAMIAPGILLIALMAITLVPPSVMQPFPGSGGRRLDGPPQPVSAKTPVQNMAGKPATAKAVVLPDEPTAAGRPLSTQKKMRDPWERKTYSKSESTL